MPLDTREARTDLTSRECAKLLCAFIGGLVQMSDLQAVRDAVTWIATKDEYWQMQAGILSALPAFMDSVVNPKS